LSSRKKCLGYPLEGDKCVEGGLNHSRTKFLKNLISGFEQGAVGLGQGKEDALTPSGGRNTVWSERNDNLAGDLQSAKRTLGPLKVEGG